MTGAAVLVVGLLLILAGLASARIPGEATFASSGISLAPGEGQAGGAGPLGIARRARSPLRAFLLSPIHPATWYANAAIGLGLFVGIFAFAVIVSLASAGFGTLVIGVGLLFFVIGIEGSRVVARIERARMALGSSERPLAHPYRPLTGGFINLVRAEFADENRWRDVLYVAVNFPLSIIEFVVILTIWSLSL